MLFQSHEDDFRDTQNDVKYTIYPLAFTRNLGNLQANSIIMPFRRRMDIIDAKLQDSMDKQDQEGQEGCEGRGGGHRHVCQHHHGLAKPGLYSDSKRNSIDSEDVCSEESDNNSTDADMPERQQRPPSAPLLELVCSQIYNAISHQLCNAAKFHKVQLGLITTLLVGTTAALFALRNRWKRNLDHYWGNLLHIHCAQKIAGPRQPQCMRFEHTYHLDMQHLSQRKHSGK